MDNNINLNTPEGRLETAIAMKALLWGIGNQDPLFVQVRRSTDWYKRTIDFRKGQLLNGQDLQANTEFLNRFVGREYDLTREIRSLEDKIPDPNQRETRSIKAFKLIQDYLADYAHTALVAVELNQADSNKINNLDTASLRTVLPKTDNAVDDSPTIPDNLEGSADARKPYEEELSRYRQIVQDAPAEFLGPYIEHTLKPRFEGIRQTLQQARESHANETLFALQNSELLDFHESLAGLLQQSYTAVRISRETAEEMQTQLSEPPASTTKKQAAFDRLNAVNADMKLYIASLDSDGLRDYYFNTLQRKSLELRRTIGKLAQIGNKPETVAFYQSFLDIITENAKDVYRKMADTAPTESVVTENQAVSPPVLSQRSAEKLAAFESLMKQATHQATGSELVKLLREKLEPKAAALTDEIKQLQQTNDGSETILVKQRHLAIISQTISDVQQKYEMEKIAAASKDLPVLHTIVVTPEEEKREVQAVLAAQQAKPVGETVGEPAAPQGKKKIGSRVWAAVTLSAMALCTAAAGFVFGIDRAQKNPEPANAPVASVAFNDAASEAARTPQQTASITVAAPANDAPSVAAPVIETTRPTGTPPTATVQPAPAKAAFKPASVAKNTRQAVVVDQPIIERTFDPADFRPGIQTTIDACKQLPEIRASGICADIISLQMK